MIYDERVEPLSSFEIIMEGDIVAVTCMTGRKICNALKISSLAKRYHSLVVWGGLHATLLPDNVLQSGMDLLNRLDMIEM